MSTIPVGGTTGHDHESTAQIDEAARWLASLPQEDRPRPIVPAMRQRFGLSPQQACIAIREAGLMHARAM
ncbi:hypothetical protein [Antarcticirhabdus aurantiaca]|uniref:Uncharacterized protein n=1 Tax=Antarcticirhabdus aurantiaca TaxID=2606717 RepID=A0ACD4NW87_9HYPH|nr:hypothetical protein [Antarcticirhabdus aurantiaca]WAJ31170.1 hypothetical protein OXU80_13605 [Jeongeuplla avenae]